MKHIILNEAFKMRDLALEGIQEVDQQLELCSKELDQPGFRKNRCYI